MKLIIAITQVAVKFPIWEHSAREAIIEGGNKEIEFINSVLDQYNETEGNAKQMEEKLGIDVIKCLQQWANKKAVEQDYFIMNECIKEDLK